MSLKTLIASAVSLIDFRPLAATHFVDGHHVKSLDRLNRDLSKVIVVDWNPHATKFHPENAFNIQRWDGDDSDTTLFDLAAFLKSKAIG